MPSTTQWKESVAELERFLSGSVFTIVSTRKTAKKESSPMSIMEARGCLADVESSPAIASGIRRAAAVAERVIFVAEFNAHIDGKMPVSIVPRHYEALVSYFAAAEALAGTPSGKARKAATENLSTARARVYSAMQRQVPA